MKLVLNPENKYISLNDEYLLISNKKSNFVINKSDFSKIKKNNIHNKKLINSNILIYDFEEFHQLNQDTKVYPKINIDKIKKENLGYLRFSSIIFIYLKRNIVFSASFLDIVKLKESKKFTLSFIVKNGYYNTIYTSDYHVFKALNKINVRCYYLYYGQLTNKNYSIDITLFVAKEKKKDFFNKKNELISFELKNDNSKCGNCNFSNICLSDAKNKEKNCKKFKEAL